MASVLPWPVVCLCLRVPAAVLVSLTATNLQNHVQGEYHGSLQAPSADAGTVMHGYSPRTSPPLLHCLMRSCYRKHIEDFQSHRFQSTLQSFLEPGGFCLVCAEPSAWPRTTSLLVDRLPEVAFCYSEHFCTHFDQAHSRAALHMHGTDGGSQADGFYVALINISLIVYFDNQRGLNQGPTDTSLAVL